MLEKIKYFTSISGALAGISVFFPFANKLINIVCVIPEYKGFAEGITPVVCAFTIFLMFSLPVSRWDPIWAFVFILFAIFLATGSIWDNSLCFQKDSVIVYITAFGFFTAAFSLLAAYNYERERL